VKLQPPARVAEPPVPSRPPTTLSVVPRNRVGFGFGFLFILNIVNGPLITAVVGGPGNKNLNNEGNKASRTTVPISSAFF
jgi:hypothetical protein